VAPSTQKKKKARFFDAMTDRPRQEVEEEEKLGNTQGFESRELVRLFEIIDRLRECGVSEDISLPQVSIATSVWFD